MKVYARVPFVAEGVHYKPNDVIADVTSELPLGSLTSLFNRPDLVALQPMPVEEPVESEVPQPETSDEPETGDESVEPESTEPTPDDSAGDSTDDSEDLDGELLAEFVDAVPAEWFASQGVTTVGELKTWVAAGNKLTDAPTIGRVGARELTEMLGL